MHSQPIPLVHEQGLPHLNAQPPRRWRANHQSYCLVGRVRIFTRLHPLEVQPCPCRDQHVHLIGGWNDHRQAQRARATSGKSLSRVVTLHTCFQQQHADPRGSRSCFCRPRGCQRLCIAALCQGRGLRPASLAPSPWSSLCAARPMIRTPRQCFSASLGRVVALLP